MSMSIAIGLARAAFPAENRMPPPKPPVTSTTSSRAPQAEQEASSVISPRAAGSKKGAIVDEDAPLIDTTEPLALKSKKTGRAQKKQERRRKKVAVTSDTKSFLELPRELLDEVLSHLAPSDVMRLQRLNSATQAYIVENEQSIAKTIVSRRYHVLSRSFHCPVPFEQLDARTQCSLLSSEWQDKSKLHRNSYYQIVRPLDPRTVCTCATCMLAWNNLNIILDLAHFQKNLNEREPIPLVARGTNPKWHTELQERNAAMVMRAMYSPLCYALILQVHLETIVGTLTRTARVGKKAAHPKRLYHMSPEDVASGTDMFLERSGPPSTTIPYHRDMYYNLEAYVPNRAWSKEKQKWLYARAPHDNDLQWIVSRFEPDRRGSV